MSPLRATSSKLKERHWASPILAEELLDAMETVPQLVKLRLGTVMDDVLRRRSPRDPSAYSVLTRPHPSVLLRPSSCLPLRPSALLAPYPCRLLQAGLGSYLYVYVDSAQADACIVPTARVRYLRIETAHVEVRPPSASDPPRRVTPLGE